MIGFLEFTRVYEKLGLCMVEVYVPFHTVVHLVLIIVIEEMDANGVTFTARPVNNKCMSVALKISYPSYSSPKNFESVKSII